VERSDGHERALGERGAQARGDQLDEFGLERLGGHRILSGDSAGAGFLSGTVEAQKIRYSPRLSS